MGEVVQFDFKKREPNRPAFTEHTPASTTFTEVLNRDIKNLSNTCGITEEEAIQMASDFYKRYPMLIEHVRSPEFMLRK